MRIARFTRWSIAALAVSCAACSAPGKSPYFDNRSRLSVLDTSPQNGETGVPLDAVIEIELGGDPASRQAVEDAFLLQEVGGPGLVVDIDLLDDENIVRIEPTGGLDLSTTYTASLTGLVDERGRAVDDYTWTFSTIDPPAPALIGSHPAPGATGVPGNFVIRAVFSVPLNPAQLSPNAIVVNGGAVGGSSTYEETSQTVTFTPNTTANGAISVSLATVTDVYGRQFAPSGWTFDASGAVIDATRPSPPAIVSATETSAGTISVTFDPSTDDQWSGSDIRYEAVLTRVNTVPADCDDIFVPESMRVAVYGSTATLSASGLEGGSWTVTLDAEDGSGRRSLPSTAGPVPLTLDPVTFDAVIQPLLTERCALNGCHTGPNPPGYVDYTGTREEIVSHEGQTGLDLVTPYCLAESYLWHKLVPGYEIVGQRMPPEGDVSASYLTRRERDLFRRWIVEQGGL